jgi:hypothetical protein
MREDTGFLSWGDKEGGIRDKGGGIREKVSQPGRKTSVRNVNFQRK